MKRLIKAFLLLAILGLAVFWFVSAPQTNAPASLADIKPDLENGELVFWASGCASCHAVKGAEGDEKLKLGGGHPLNTPFGTFLTPNISAHPETGIGSWSNQDFYNAMVSGVSPSGDHYYPSFPYASYARMSEQDIIDLFGYLKTLPSIDRANENHDLPLPFQWRRTLGVWKAMFLNDDPIVEVPADDPVLMRGQYLVEGIAHCGECHTPRNPLGGPQYNAWLAGAAAAEGEGFVPNITPHESGIETWTETDITFYLESGFTPDYDSAGGSMTDVVRNMAKLPKSDLEAIAKYLKSLPPIQSAKK